MLLERPVELLLIEDNRAHARLVLEALRVSPLPTHLSVARNGYEASAFVNRQGAYAAAPPVRSHLAE